MDMSRTLDKSLRKLSTSRRRSNNENVNPDYNRTQRQSRSKTKFQKKRAHTSSVPSYLKGTVSSLNKGHKAQNTQDTRKLENIFFSKREGDKPLTESELRDSNIQLNKSSSFRRSSSQKREDKNYGNLLTTEILEQEFSRVEPKEKLSRHSRQTKDLKSQGELDTIEKKDTAHFKNAQISPKYQDPKTVKTNDDIIDLFTKEELKLTTQGNPDPTYFVVYLSFIDLSIGPNQSKLMFLSLPIFLSFLIVLKGQRGLVWVRS